MFAGLVSQINSLYGFIPRISKYQGALELSALVGESYVWGLKANNSDGKKVKTYLLVLCKTVQIVSFLGFIPMLASCNGYYFSAVALAGFATFYTHTIPKNSDNFTEHSVVSAQVLALNITSKMANSFAIGQIAYQTLYDQEPGVGMLDTTFVALGLSSFNVISDLYGLSDLRGD